MVVEPYGYAMTSSNQMDLTFAALSDPTRRAILVRLASGEASVKELAKPFAMSQPAVSKHLKVLQRAGLITHGQDAQRRPRRIQGKGLGGATEWLQQFREFWDGSFQRLDDLLEEMRATERKKERRKGRRKKS
jgi:DNA-binding transcriptional ArsR family regulator